MAAVAQAAELPSPTTAADLYLRTLVNHDEQAISQLNDYLRPNRLRSKRSPDYANAAELKAADRDFPGEVAEMVLSLFPEAQRKDLKAPAETLMRTVQQARQKSECKAGAASKPQRDKYGVLNTQVQFECLLVKTPETWAEGIQRMARNKLGTAQVVTELQALQKAYAAPASFNYQGAFPLSIVPKDKDKAWRNDFAHETVDEMFSEL
ncbi:hypothetical protein [Comamonas guangdongensis]|uniref:hypothetical protein n=1 Tax=Comamonas guangdongensis TaxID=510515 RepID=UPI0034E2C887